MARSKEGSWLSCVIYIRIPSTQDTDSYVPPSCDTAKAQIPIAMVTCPCKYNSEFIHTQKQLLCILDFQLFGQCCQLLIMHLIPEEKKKKKSYLELF